MRNAWRTVRGEIYYFSDTGAALTGVKKVGDFRYFFQSTGELLMPDETELIETPEGAYAVNEEGQVLTDWQLVEGVLYHFERNGKRTEDDLVDRVELNSLGRAAKCNAQRAKVKALKILDKVTTSDMTRSQKLKTAWKYLVSRAHFKYRAKYPNLKAKDWQHLLALDMFTKRSGNCYGFACAFAQFAEVLGFEPKIVLGRVSGSRDGASDGLTRHSWVRIKGKNYDPEGHFAGWVRSVYGRSYYPVRHTVQKVMPY